MVSPHQHGYGGDMALYPIQKNTNRQKYSGDSQAYAKQLVTLRCPVLNEEACRHQDCGGEAESDCTEINCSECNEQASVPSLC